MRNRHMRLFSGHKSHIGIFKGHPPRIRSMSSKVIVPSDPILNIPSFFLSQAGILFPPGRPRGCTGTARFPGAGCISFCKVARQRIGKSRPHHETRPYRSEENLRIFFFKASHPRFDLLFIFSVCEIIVAPERTFLVRRSGLSG